LNDLVELKDKKAMSGLKKLITVKVTIQDGEEYEVESCWSQETEAFCEKIAGEVKRFVETMNSESEVIVE